MLTGELVFVTGSSPRQGVFARWGHGQGDGAVELVVAGGTYGVRRRRQAAQLIGVADAVPLLLAITPGDEPEAASAAGPSASVRAWAAAATAGIGLLARGRLTPTVGDDGSDVWRAGPLDPADLTWLRALAAAFPPMAHALPVPGSRPMRIRSAEALIRALWDAMADAMVRTAAAPRTTRSAAFAAQQPTQVGDLAEWLADGVGSLAAGAQLSLRVEDVAPREPAGVLEEAAAADDAEAPPGDAPVLRAVLQLRSTADPSLIVDAAHLWEQPDTVLSRFGDQAETDLFLALRRGSEVWSPLAATLRQACPTDVDLDDEAVAELLGPVAERLSAVGIELLWPARLAADGLELKAVVTPAPGQVVEAGFNLTALLAFRWQLTLDGEVLDAEEISALADAKRPMVRLLGRWVMLDPALLDRLRRPPRTQLSGIEALGAVLAGVAEIDGEQVAVVAEGAVAELAQRLTGLAAAPEQLAAPSGLLATLRPYQQRGMSWMNAMCDIGFGGCLADDMGLGKTIQVIALHLHRRDRQAGPTLVVCPASLLGTWEREVHRFAPDLPVRRYHGGGRHLRELAADEIVLVTYGILMRDVAELSCVEWGLVVADEAQHAKNPLTRTARELRAVPAPARIALTGTPIENRLSELWSILDWTTPGLLGPLESFTRRVAVPVERHRDAAAITRFAAAVRPFLMRRKKTDPGIAPELPPKTETDRIVPLSAEQVTLYEAVVREALADIATKTGIERAGLVFKLLTGLKQICNHPAHYLKQTQPLAGRSGKLLALDELLDVILAGDESVLVFSQYTAMGTLLQQHLHERGIGSLFLHGGVPLRRREEMVAEFQVGRVPVFVLSLKAGGTGLTLTRATHVIHYDRWWNPAVENQATDRAYRIGQDRPVQVHRMITEGTLEDRIAALMEKKRELAEAVISSGEGWIADLSDDELAGLVALQRSP